MYSTVRRYDGLDNTAEIGRKVQEGFVPLLKKMPGFVAYYWADAGNGVVISTTIFESKAAAEDSNRRAADWLRANLTPYASAPVQVTTGEIVATASQLRAAA